MYNFETNLIEKEKIDMGGTTEYIIRGGRDRFPLLPKAFDGIKTIGVLGWGSQGAAQSRNLRDSLEGITVKVGLRNGSASWEKARESGFREEDGTLGEMMQVAGESDMVILLISDAAQTEIYKKLFSVMKPGATLGLSHGFLSGYLSMTGEEFPENINIIAVCPKGMGPSVRRLYEQGRKINGAGINCSFAIHRDITGKATDHAIGWAIAIGAPYLFMTALDKEYKSDIFGERGVLLGGIYGLTESLYRYFISQGMDDKTAFINSAESLTGPISAAISKTGMIGLYNSLDENERKQFEAAYSSSYNNLKMILEEIYEEVESGIEIRSMLLSGRRLKKYPMEEVGMTPMWRTGKKIRQARGTFDVPLNPGVAGLYTAMMMAQADILIEQNHTVSEIVNESVIEAVDSLNPFMHHRGIAYMIDNCSVTARVGARKWGPRFDYILTQGTLPRLKSGDRDSRLIEKFLKHGIHNALETAAQFRPPVNISVTGG